MVKCAYKWYKWRNACDTTVKLNHYVIVTDQGTFERDCKYLDFSKARENYEKAGYTNIDIRCLGKAVGFV